MMDISKNIKAIRESKGYTQARLADSLQMERANYHRLENRGTKMTIEQLQSVADALGVSLGEVLGIEGTTGEVETGRIKELEKRVKELEDRIKDKDFKLKAFEKESYMLKSLIFNSLSHAVNHALKLSDYMDFIKRNPWILSLLSGLHLNKIQVKEETWNKYWSKATTKYIKEYEAGTLVSDDPNLDIDIFLGEMTYSLLGEVPSALDDMDEYTKWMNDPKNEVESISFFMQFELPKEEGEDEYLPEK